MSSLRKTIALPLAGDEVHVDVTTRIIEIVERVYDTNVDVVSTILLVDPSRVKLTQLAEVVSLWLTPGQLEQVGLKRREIPEAIYESSPEDIGRVVGCIQAACLFTRRHINEDEMRKLAMGEDLDDGKQEAPAPKKKPARRKSTPKRSTGS